MTHAIRSLEAGTIVQGNHVFKQVQTQFYEDTRYSLTMVDPDDGHVTVVSIITHMLTCRLGWEVTDRGCTIKKWMHPDASYSTTINSALRQARKMSKETIVR